jgi:C4-dicarboxylate transporter DctM subunit
MAASRRRPRPPRSRPPMRCSSRWSLPQRHRRDLYGSVLTAPTTASIGMLIAGALVFNYVVTIENIPETLRALLAGTSRRWLPAAGQRHAADPRLPARRHDDPPGHRAGLIPTAQALGIDMVHFGVVVVVNIMLGLITPPYGLLLFIMTRIANAPLRALMARHVAPFLARPASLRCSIFTFVPTRCCGCRGDGSATWPRW